MGGGDCGEKSVRPASLSASASEDAGNPSSSLHSRSGAPGGVAFGGRHPSMDISSFVGSAVGVWMISCRDGGGGVTGGRLCGYPKGDRGDTRTSGVRGDSNATDTTSTGGAFEIVDVCEGKVMPRPVAVFGTLTFWRTSERKTGGRRADRSMEWGRATAAANLVGR